MEIKMGMNKRTIKLFSFARVEELYPLKKGSTLSGVPR